MNSEHLVFDIETFCEREEDSSAYPYPRSSSMIIADYGYHLDEDASGKNFPPIFTHRVIAIGGMILDRNLNFKRIGLFAPDSPSKTSSPQGQLDLSSNQGSAEREVLRRFHDYISRHFPVLVSFNGRRFDIPVVVLRSLKHGLDMKWYFESQRYSRRYFPTDHIDICDILSGYGSGSYISLENACMLMGLRAKIAMRGEDVQKHYLAGNLSRIQLYCMEDVVVTTILFLRLRLVMGQLDASRYNEKISYIFEGLEADGRFTHFLENVDIDSIKV